MSSADFSYPFSVNRFTDSSFEQRMRSPKVRCISFTRSCQIYWNNSREVSWASTSKAVLPCRSSLIFGFCSSPPCFVIGFLQIPPHEGHPCLDSLFRLPRRAEDFHLQDLHHAWRHFNWASTRPAPRRVVLFRQKSNPQKHGVPQDRYFVR